MIHVHDAFSDRYARNSFKTLKCTSLKESCLRVYLVEGLKTSFIGVEGPTLVGFDTEGNFLIPTFGIAKKEIIFMRQLTLVALLDQVHTRKPNSHTYHALYRPQQQHSLFEGTLRVFPKSIT